MLNLGRGLRRALIVSKAGNPPAGRATAGAALIWITAHEGPQRRL